MTDRRVILADIASNATHRGIPMSAAARRSTTQRITATTNAPTAAAAVPRRS